MTGGMRPSPDVVAVGDFDEVTGLAPDRRLSQSLDSFHLGEIAIEGADRNMPRLLRYAKDETGGEIHCHSPSIILQRLGDYVGVL